MASLTETQSITNSGYDFHDRVAHSSITTTNALGVFVDRQEINYVSYDQFGNVVDQTVERYDQTDALIDYKVINNVYSDPVAAKKGNATHTTINRYSSKDTLDTTTLIERQEISNKSFDAIGNVVDQEVEVYVQGKLSKKTVIKNSGISNSGDASNQEITTYSTDSTGNLLAKEVKKVIVVITNAE